jgi:hypothetical protein
MEGTRHERVALIIAAYIIGFLTAFIGFGIDVGQPTSFTQVIPANIQDNSASVSSALSLSTAINSSIAITDTGLELTTDGVTVLLAASQYAVTPNTPQGQDGVFIGISSYGVSPDGSYAYFCELPSRNVDSCKPFVYSVLSQTVYPVTIDSERVAFEATKHNVVWNSAGLVSVDSVLVDALPE